MRKMLCFAVAAILMILATPAVRADESVIAYCIMPLHSDTVIREYDSEQKCNIAGMTKLPAVLTLCAAFDQGMIDENANVSVSAKAASIGGPSAYLDKGETVPAKELIRAAVMISAGDAIYALAEHAFGSEDVFLKNIALTMRAAGVDMELDDCLGMYMTFSCRELIALGEAAIDSRTFMKYCSEKYAVLTHANGRKTELSTSNKLLTTLPGCIGLFTGSSKTDGYCGLFACKRGETVYVCALIGANNSKTRFDIASKLFEEAFANYHYVTVCDTDEPQVESYPVEGASVDAVDLYTKESCSILLKKSDGEPQRKIDLPEQLSAPLDPDHAVGTIAYYDADGSLLLEQALYPKDIVVSSGFMEILKRTFVIFVNG